MVRISKGLSIASQQSNLWRNDVGSTDKQRTDERYFWVFLYTQRMRLTQIGGWRYVIRYISFPPKTLQFCGAENPTDFYVI